jgi:type IV secretory pathway TrbF-like protein
MLVFAKEAIGVPMEMSPYAEAQKLWNDRTTPIAVTT